MAKLRDSIISEKDLADFANADSDFGFEMQVLRQLRADGFNCSHSGTYRDPVTDKIRQFDIRAFVVREESRLALAVECKNLRPNNPLLLSALPRTAAEAFHSFVKMIPNWALPVVRQLEGTSSAYKPGDMVAKKTDQVGRMESTGELISNDEATFEKLNQAVNSCQELVIASLRVPLQQFRQVIVPVLVLPTGVLWQVNYDMDGAIATLPRQVDRATLFIDHTWPVAGAFGEIQRYRLSHIEIVTLGALSDASRAWLGPEGFFRG